MLVDVSFMSAGCPKLTADELIRVVYKGRYGKVHKYHIVFYCKFDKNRYKCYNLIVFVKLIRKYSSRYRNVN